MTTVETISKAQVQRLRTEAIEHGDDVMVDICDAALCKWSDQPPASVSERKAIESGLYECALAINDREAAP